MITDAIVTGLLKRLEEDRRWRLMPARTLLKLTGPDSERFLDGQVANRVAKAKLGEVVPACLCNVKGKVMALVWISYRDDAWWVDGERSQREMIYQRLDRYLIADDCEMVDVSEEWCLLHHWDMDQPGQPARRLAHAGKDRWLPLSDDGTDVRGWPEDQAIAEQEWRLLSTLSRLPEVGNEINGEEFPSELGLDLWAVDFHKGCYLGQEIVSRLESVGRVKRTLCGVYGQEVPPKGERMLLASGHEAVVTRDPLVVNGLRLSLACVKAARESLGPKNWWAGDGEPEAAPLDWNGSTKILLEKL